MSVEKEVARKAAIIELMRSGCSREWAEEHLLDASFEKGQLSYSVQPDKPVEILHGKFSTKGRRKR